MVLKIVGLRCMNEGMTLFIFQGSISSLLMMVLAAKDGEDVLELCATNTGKTPHIGGSVI